VSTRGWDSGYGREKGTTPWCGGIAAFSSPLISEVGKLAPHSITGPSVFPAFSGVGSAAATTATSLRSTVSCRVGVEFQCLAAEHTHGCGVTGARVYFCQLGRKAGVSRKLLCSLATPVLLPSPCGLVDRRKLCQQESWIHRDTSLELFDCFCIMVSVVKLPPQ
jgi:hypothetical protein